MPSTVVAMEQPRGKLFGIEGGNFGFRTTVRVQCVGATVQHDTGEIRSIVPLVRRWSKITVCALFGSHKVLYALLFSFHSLSSSFLSCALIVVTQIQVHVVDSFPPPPTTVRALHFYREKDSALSSFVEARRTVSTNAIIGIGALGS